MKKRRVLRKTLAISVLTLFLVLPSAAVFAAAPAPPPPPPPAPEPEYLPPAGTAVEVYVSFQSLYNNLHVRVENGCGYNVKADRNVPDSYVDEIFIMNGSNGLQDGTTVNIRTAEYGCYFSAQSDGELDADRSAANTWETFKLINVTNPGGPLQDGDTIGLKSVHGKYVRVDMNTGDNRMLAASTVFDGDNEKFRVIFKAAPGDTSEKLVTLRNVWNGKYVAALGSGRSEFIRAERNNSNDFAEEQFRMTALGYDDWSRVPDGATVTLRSTAGYYWVVGDDGDLDVKETKLKDRCKFKLINVTNPGGFLRDGDTIGLETFAGQYVRVRMNVENGGMTAGSTVFDGDNEKFVVDFLPEPAPLTIGVFEGETINFHDGVGQTRFFRYYIPDVEGPLPVMFDLHGLSGHAEGMEYYHKFGTMARETKEFIWIAPEGTDYENGINTLFPANSWNGVVCCPSASSATPLFGGAGVHDVEYLRALVSYISQRANVDLDRVYAHGHSNGAAMVHQLGLQAADIFAAISPAAFPLSDSPWANAITQYPDRPIPVFNIWGAYDQLLVIIPGYIPYGTVYDGVNDWARMNGCDMNSANPGPFPVEYTATYTGCDCGVEVELWQIPTMHEVYDYGPLLNERVWNFFKRFTRQCAANN